MEEFVADVTSIGNVVRKTNRNVDELTLGTASEEIGRLLQKNHAWINLNPYEVLALPYDLATKEDVKQRYRALSGILHPDKCSLEGARESFEYVSSSYREISNEGRRSVILGMIGGAHSRALQELKREGKLRKKEDDIELHNRRASKLTRIAFAEAEEAKRRAEKNSQAYRKREDDQSKESQKKIKEEYHHEKEWQAGVDDRVDSWQSFAGVKKKK